MPERIHATYLIETSYDIVAVASQLAGEQSTSTSVRIQGETQRLTRSFGAVVESIQEEATVAQPSLPTHAAGTGPWKRARIRISWPLHNVGHSLPQLYVTLLGNQTGMRQLTGIRLEHLQVPEELIRASPRPAFGIEGSRRLSGVYGRPLIGTIVKPNIGLSPSQTAEIVDRLIESGVDFIKDDELIANPPYSPIQERVGKVMDVVNRHADRSGRKIMVAFNITDEIDEMRRHHDFVQKSGGTCVMANLNSIGLTGALALRRHAQLPLHGHRAGWAMLTRCPMLGMDFQPYQLLYRLAGFDHLHVSGLGGKFWEEKRSVLESARNCLTRIDTAAQAPDDRSMPVFSGGSTIWDVAPTYLEFGSKDLIFTTGAAIFGHPGGMAAGVASLRQAWEAAMAGESLESYCAARPELRLAMEQARPGK